METGFLNHPHDEEHFVSTFYNQGSVLEDNDHILFGEMIVPEIIDYDNLWPSNDDAGASSHGDDRVQKEDFQKLLYEWQHQLNYMQEPTVIEKIVPLGSAPKVTDMFPSSDTATNTPAPSVDPSIDELFPLDVSNRDIPSEDIGNIQKESNHAAGETVITIHTKTEPSNSTETIELDSNFAFNKIENGVKTAAPEVKKDSVVTIKTEVEDDRVDVETVGGDEIPLLMARDLTSLLEQFEATEKVNAVQASNQMLQTPSPPRPSSQTIRDALPEEVISRIKATRENHKKMISVIPAMPNKRPGRGATRMQDAGATLSRNKLLKLVTGGSSGESVQLDHDYCTSGCDSTSVSSRSNYMSDSSEYPSQSSTPDTVSRMPEYRNRDTTRGRDTGSRKDSGLESGENSEEEVPPVTEKINRIVLKSSTGLKCVNVVNENGVVIGGAAMMHKNVPMVSVLKKNIKVEKDIVSNSSAIHVSESSSAVVKSETCTQGEMDSKEFVRKKRKLNLEEYRVRREERERVRSQESSRANSPAACPTPPAQPDSTSSAGPQEGASKEKPLMLSVEVQTQTCDFIDLTTSKSSTDHEKSRMDKVKRNDLKHRSYQSRHASSSSSVASSSSTESDRHHSHRRKRSSRRRSRSRRRNSVSRMWSRSPSSSSGTQSDTSSRSRTRSRSRSRDRRQKWRSRSPLRNSRYESPRSYRGDRDRSWQRKCTQDFPTQEKVRQVEERRVIYVGRIDEGTTKADLRRRFQQFGPIVDISVHFRERGDNYGFVTFAYKADAYKAVEHGNDDPKQPRYDLCFGGRRAFCKQRYADLDGLATNMHCQYGPPTMQPRHNDSFDLLLNQVKAQLRKRSSV